MAVGAYLRPSHASIALAAGSSYLRDALLQLLGLLVHALDEIDLRTHARVSCITASCRQGHGMAHAPLCRSQPHFKPP